MRGQGCNGPTYILTLCHSVIFLCLPLPSWQYYDNHSLVFVNETSDKMISEWMKPKSINSSHISRTDLSAAPLNVTWPKQVRFCNTPDFPDEEMYFNTTGKRRKRYLLQGSRWDKHTLTWTLRTPSRRPELSERVIRQQMYAAFKVWQDASTLVFQEVHKDTESVDIYVDFVTGDHNDGYKFDGKGNVLAHAFYPGVDRGGDVHFDDDETFVTHSEATEHDRHSLLITAAHELGHSLGITHSNSPNALMVPWYQDFPEDFTLPDDDKLAIQALYGKPISDSPDHTRIPTYEPPKPTSTRAPNRPLTSTHKPPPTTPYIPPSSDIPDTCNTDFDAVTMFRNEMFLFKGKYFWRINSSGHLLDDTDPAEIHRLFRQLPKTVDHIDAVYEDLIDNSLVFISGSKYYKLFGNRVGSGDLRDLNINASHVDAAMVWGHNGRTYLFSGEWYWRLNRDGVAEEDYPRYIGVWHGVPENFSAAFTKGSTTYFIAGKVFWKFDTLSMSVSGNPSLVAPYWLNCPYYNQKQQKQHSLAPSQVASYILHLLCSVFALFAVHLFQTLQF